MRICENKPLALQSMCAMSIAINRIGHVSSNNMIAIMTSNIRFMARCNKVKELGPFKYSRVS